MFALSVFLIFFLFINCKKENSSSDPTFPAPGPVERMSIDELTVQSMKFSNGLNIEYKLLLDKPEIAAALFLLKKDEEIPKHFHKIDKAIYIYEGQAEIFAQNKINPVQKGDTVYVPKNSVTNIKNTNKDVTSVFIFFQSEILNRLHLVLQK